MNVFLWVLQILLAVLFLVAGATKLTQSKDQLRAKKMNWVDDVSDNGIKAIAGLEVLGALGLVLPWALDIAPVLTPIAAVGLAITMIGAVVVHVRRKEPFYAQLVLTVLCLVVAWGRF